MKLPFELWRVILSHCDTETLKECMLVSKDFRELIIRSPEVMENLPLIHNDHNLPHKLAFVEEYGKYVKSVKFIDFPLVKFMTQFKKTPNVKHLIMVTPGCFRRGANQQVVEYPDRTINFELNSLEIWRASGYRTYEYSTIEIKQILHVIKDCTSLKKIKINSIIEESVKEIEDFIARQKHLEEISLLHKTNLSIFTDQLVRQEDFKLKTLVLTCELPYNQKLSNFLRQQAENITNIQLGFQDSKVDFHYYRLVLSTFTKLKKISLSVIYNIDGIRAEEISRFRLPNVTELKIFEHVDDPNILNAVIDMFPNLELLSLSARSYFLKDVLSKLPKLRKIESPYFYLETMFVGQSSSLKELDVCIESIIFESIFWEKLAKNCPNLERLTIRNFSFEQLTATINTVIGCILKSLVYFKNLEYCMIQNEISDLLPINKDNDNPEHVVTANTTRFRLIFEANYDGSFSLTFPKHLIKNHTESINFLKNHYVISNFTEK